MKSCTGDLISILIDSSVLISAYNKRDMNHEKGQKILHEIESGKFGEWLISDYIFDEVVTVMFSKLHSKEATAALGRHLLKACTMLTVPPAIFIEAFTVFSQKNKLSFTDSTLLAMADKYGIEHIATFDKEIRRHFRNCVDS